jgi:hypothetical protein
MEFFGVLTEKKYPLPESADISGNSVDGMRTPHFLNLLCEIWWGLGCSALKNAFVLPTRGTSSAMRFIPK